MRKRMTSLLLTLVMLLSLVPAMGVTASAAEPVWTIVNSFEDLKAAVKNKQEYIQLGQDIDTSSLNEGNGLTISGFLSFEDKNFVLDLNGNTLNLKSNFDSVQLFIQVADGSLTIKDSSDTKTGAITGLFGSVRGGVPCYLIFVGKNGNLTLDSGTFKVEGKPYAFEVEVVRSLNGNVTIKNGAKLIQPEFADSGYASALDGIGYALRAEGKSNVIIEGGEFDGCVKLTGSQAENGSVQIKGGTFKKDVQVLYEAEENNSNPAVTVNGGTFEGNVYLQYWPWKESLYMPYRLNGGTFKGTVNLHTDRGIYEDNNPTVNPNIVRGLDKCFGYSAVVTPNDTFTGPDASTAVLKKAASGESYKMLLEGNESNPVQIIPNAWGMMESVTLDGKQPIDYAKDWNGTPVVIKNNEDHTITFKWKDLADKLKAEGYRYDAYCMRYTSGDTTGLIPTDQIPTGTEYSFTIKKGADPNVYSFDLRLDLKKGSRPVNTFANQHIVRLVVVEAPVAPPSLTGQVYYTSGIVYGSPISTGTGDLPTGLNSSKLHYQWQRSTDGGEWTDIANATSGSYTPVDADMGKNVRIRVVVTAEGYLGEIVGAPVKVNKAANNGYPAVIQLEAMKDSAGNYIGFEITNFDSDCEYVYSETSEPDWSKNKINSATETGLASNTTYYVFARFKETATHTAGSIVSKNSIKLYEHVPLQYVLLEGYVSGEKIYIKKDESVTLKVSADPSNANSWNEIAFKDSNVSSLGTSNIKISGEKIAASGENAASFPNDHFITITGVSKGSTTLSASYPGPTNAYGTWTVVVYDDPPDALRLENVYTYENITLSVNDEAELPTELPKLLPENSGYHLEWRIVQTGIGTGGALYKTSDDNIELVGGKIKPKAAHALSGKTRLDLVAVKDNSDTYRTLSETPIFYVTVTEAPVIELTGVTVAPTKVNLEPNATCQLSAVKEPANALGDLTWESNNTGVATVDGNGKVTAVAKGEATITVTCGKKTATCTVLVDHKHDYAGQSWLYLDPGNHYQECVANDGSYNVEAHDFNAWTKDNETTHSRHCNVCKKSGETKFYTETANHNWQWVVDTAATPNAAGKKHEECVDCHAKRSENTEIPMLTSIMVEHLTVAKPVKDAAATAPTTTDSTYYVANTEWTAADGTPLAIGEKFQPGTVYTVKITLETAGAGVFSANSTYNTIEGKTATSPNLTGDAHTDSVILTYTFDKTAGGYHPGTGTGTGVTTYPITVKSAKNGDVTASHKSASKGTAVTLTVDPDKGYVLDTLTVLDGKDKEIKLTEKNGKYTFTMPDSKVTVAATFKASVPTGKNPFIDVPAGSYYEDAVVWAVEKGITSGTSAVTFDPNGNCTRAQAVTFLWRAAGSPAPKTKVMPFADVKAGSYYYDAVLWAMEQGITKGTSDTAFSPNASCTRAQIVTFLWRANGSPVVSGNSAFTDVAADAYYAAAVTWAEKNGVTGGIGNGLFGSGNNCTRAQIVTFLYRAMK